MRAVIIGAGAAGCFCAIQLKRWVPGLSVTVLEAGPRALAKVAITGGGRCNLTHSFAGIRSLAEAYPRGARAMERVFRLFDHQDAWDWFTAEGVPLVLQEDQCVFPASQDAGDIVRVLLRGMRTAGVELQTGVRVERIEATESGYRVVSGARTWEAGKVIVTTGGSPRESGLRFLDGLGLSLVSPVPSLFTLTLPEPEFRALMGTVVPAALSIPGTHFRAAGPLLVTDWGLSGPATLKLSSYAARFLAERQYRTELCIHWLPERNEQEIREILDECCNANARKLIQSVPPGGLPSRLWNYLLNRAGIRSDMRCGELGSKGRNRLAATLSADVHAVAGKGRFREEFVTCGGVALDNVAIPSLESKKHPGLYFAGEVLDIDAITGGFNLQAAWSTGYAVARSIASDQEVR